jgi:hypothetical protein
MHAGQNRTLYSTAPMHMGAYPGHYVQIAMHVATGDLDVYYY